MFIYSKEITTYIKLRWQWRRFFCKYPLTIICFILVLAFLIHSNFGIILFVLFVISERDIFDYHQRILAEREIGDPNIEFCFFEPQELLKLTLVQRCILRGKVLLDIAEIRTKKDCSSAFYSWKSNKAYIGKDKVINMSTPSYVDVLRTDFDSIRYSPSGDKIEEYLTPSILECLLVSIRSKGLD